MKERDDVRESGRGRGVKTATQKERRGGGAEEKSNTKISLCVQ